MKKLLLAALVSLCAWPAFGQSAVKIQTPTGKGNSYQDVSPSNPLPAGFYDPSTGTLINPTLPQQVVGNVASGSVDSGNAVKTGCVYNSSGITLNTGQRGDTQCNQKGFAAIWSVGNITAADGRSNTLVGGLFDQGGNSQALLDYPYIFNGSTWDRQSTCANSAVVNVTAGNTTELVALTASQSIRVCSVAISASAAGTAQLLYGTGTNCGTSPQNLTGAMSLATGTPLSVSAGNGSLFRTAASNALCLAAVTGNVTGFISYAKY